MQKIQAVVFDWAGTMIDFGSFAPASAFVKTFAEFGITITHEEARGPMGMGKRDHIETLLKLPSVIRQFESGKGQGPDEAALNTLYEMFLPINESIVTDHADLVPGAAEMVLELRNRDIKIGSTTGYTRSIMEPVLPIAAKHGYSPDALVCSDEVPAGRPAPHAMRKCLLELGVSDPTAVIKVDDTEPGIGEGKEIGCITVGVSLSGNFAAVTPDELAQMDEKAVNHIREHVTQKLKAAGADYVIDTVAKLPALMEMLEKR